MLSAALASAMRLALASFSRALALTSSWKRARSPSEPSSEVPESTGESGPLSLDVVAAKPGVGVVGLWGPGLRECVEVHVTKQCVCCVVGYLHIDHEHQASSMKTAGLIARRKGAQANQVKGAQANQVSKRKDAVPPAHHA